VKDKLLSGRRVLVVEDEMLVMMDLEDMLADLGCESVTVAGTVEQAVALVESQDFDAALLDMNLNGRKSDAVAEALAARGVPFAFSTGYNKSDPGVGAAAGRPVLKKPFQHEKLVEILTRLLPI
jgi:CheY-like chemotaxis protein